MIRSAVSLSVVNRSRGKPSKAERVVFMTERPSIPVRMWVPLRPTLSTAVLVSDSPYVDLDVAPNDLFPQCGFNNGTGVAGACPECMILSVKVLDDNGSGSTSNVASGIVYAADAGASVISLSLGGSGQTETMHSAIDYAFSHDVLPVCAMGNSNNASATPEPAYWFNCLSVIATDQSGKKASFSNYGVKADVAAPGVAILSTMPTYPVTLTTNYGYGENYDALSGTSMATPLVAGIAGLVRSQNPGLDAARVKGILMAAAGDGQTFDNNLGFGLVNAAKALAAATPPVENTPPTTNMVSPASGATLLTIRVKRRRSMMPVPRTASRPGTSCA